MTTPADIAAHVAPRGAAITTPSGAPIRPVFRCRVDHVAMALEDSESLDVSRATIEADGGHLDGVALFTRGKPRIAVTVDAAVKLYNSLGDVLDELGVE